MNKLLGLAKEASKCSKEDIWDDKCRNCSNAHFDGECLWVCSNDQCEERVKTTTGG